MCNNLDGGYTPNQNAEMVYNTGDSTMDSYSAGQFVAFAIKDLCPWHLGQGSYASKPYGGSGGRSSTGSGTWA